MARVTSQLALGILFPAFSESEFAVGQRRDLVLDLTRQVLSHLPALLYSSHSNIR